LLFPTLKPGDVVILDNLARVGERRATGDPSRQRAPLFLPEYACGLYPIEQVFVKFKTLP